MQGMIEAISKNREGAMMIKIVFSDMAASELRLGEAELTQRAFVQMTFEEG